MMSEKEVFGEVEDPILIEAPIEPPYARGQLPEVVTPGVQRVVPRQPVEWNAKYRFRDDPKSKWRDCRFADISSAGGGLRLFGVTAEEAEGRPIDVLVQLSGEVRSTVPTKKKSMKNDVRVGVEFVDIAGDAAKFVEELRRRGVRW